MFNLVCGYTHPVNTLQIDAGESWNSVRGGNLLNGSKYWLGLRRRIDETVFGGLDVESSFNIRVSES